MLFQPSAQHTAALCLQRPNEGLTREPSIRSSSSSSRSSSASLNGSSSNEAQRSSGVQGIANSPEASRKAVEASSRVPLEGNDSPVRAKGGNSTGSQRLSLSGGSQAMHGSRADSVESVGSRESDMSDAASFSSVDSTMSDHETRSLERRLISWRVAPLAAPLEQ